MQSLSPVNESEINGYTAIVIRIAVYLWPLAGREPHQDRAAVLASVPHAPP
jgi:hypothetical protein